MIWGFAVREALFYTSEQRCARGATGCAAMRQGAGGKATGGERTTTRDGAPKLSEG